MKGTVNESLVIGLANRLRAAKESPGERQRVIGELLDAIWAEDKATMAKAGSATNEIDSVIDSIMSAETKPTREEIERTLANVRGHLAKATDPEKIAALHRAVCRLRAL